MRTHGPVGPPGDGEHCNMDECMLGASVHSFTCGAVEYAFPALFAVFGAKIAVMPCSQVNYSMLCGRVCS